MPKITRKKHTAHIERKIAIGAIVSKHVCQDLSATYDADLVEVPYVRTVIEWCLEYFQTYQEAPGKEIQTIFNSKSRRGLDEDTSELLEDFLAEIAEEYQEHSTFNADYLIDQMHDKFMAQKLKNAAEDIKVLVDQGKLDAAEAVASSLRGFEGASNTGVTPFGDTAVLRQAFETVTTPLFTFPGAFGEMVNDQLTRGGLLAFLGRAKIGKSWQLMEWAYRALRSRCNVAVFEVGDQCQDEMVVRFNVRLAGRSNRTRYCGEMMVPVLDCVKNQEDRCRNKHRTSECGLGDATNWDDAPADYVPCSYCASHRPRAYQGATWYKLCPKVSPLTWRQAVKSGNKLNRFVGSKRLRLCTFPNSSVNVTGLETVLDRWEVQEGFVPDVIVIDYADILAPQFDDLKKEIRHQENGKWKALRRMAQERYCLVVTATQANASAYKKNRVDMTNFNEDRRKNDHVTGLLGLNQTPEEKDLGEMRIGWLLLRQGEYDENDLVTVLQCLQKGQPHIGSYKQRRRSKKGER